ncbi:unnamed protein product [Nyctereutes procyonoides]|uniref:(raccoon dog) hypothetical protein n=1 Tax=Nyctereutes procyonoides TaxID=34880 RepID=A0A811YJA8_NYCPR|nr:unnamed protein product [Nyctereutes procyonoides]
MPARQRQAHQAQLPWPLPWPTSHLIIWDSQGRLLGGSDMEQRPGWSEEPAPRLPGSFPPGKAQGGQALCARCPGESRLLSWSSLAVASGPGSSRLPSATLIVDHSPQGPRMAAADPVILSHQAKGQPQMNRSSLPRVSLSLKKYFIYIFEREREHKQGEFPINLRWSPRHISLARFGSHEPLARGIGQPSIGLDQGSANAAPSLFL